MLEWTLVYKKMQRKLSRPVRSRFMARIQNRNTKDNTSFESMANSNTPLQVPTNIRKKMK
jgi:hypothetical protein